VTLFQPLMMIEFSRPTLPRSPCLRAPPNSLTKGIAGRRRRRGSPRYDHRGGCLRLLTGCPGQGSSDSPCCLACRSPSEMAGLATWLITSRSRDAPNRGVPACQARGAEVYGEFMSSHRASSRLDIRNRVAGRMLRLFNPVVRRLVSAGLPTGAPNVLLEMRGRRSGRIRTVPVGMLELDGRSFVQASYGEIGWVANLRADGEATVVHPGGRRTSVHVVELSPEEGGAVLGRALRRFRRSRVMRALLGQTSGHPSASCGGCGFASMTHPRNTPPRLGATHSSNSDGPTKEGGAWPDGCDSIQVTGMLAIVKVRILSVPPHSGARSPRQPQTVGGAASPASGCDG
jgi:deazaflavin-dependent oxidoreductase (nitroreductase family)